MPCCFELLLDLLPLLVTGLPVCEGDLCSIHHCHAIPRSFPTLKAVESSILSKVGVSLHAHDLMTHQVGFWGNLNISLNMQLLGFDQLKRSCPVLLRSFLLPVFGGGRKCRCDDSNRSLILRSLKFSLLCMLRCHLLRKEHSKTVPAVVSCSIKVIRMAECRPLILKNPCQKHVV